MRCDKCGEIFTSEDEPCELIRGKTVGEYMEEGENEDK